jgi:Flp pilus assembly pilin Flp
MHRRNDDDGKQPPRAQTREPRAPRGLTRLVRRCAADESGSASIEYLAVTMACGLLVAIGLLAAIGPSLVSMWSARRACLYDAVCLSPEQR